VAPWPASGAVQRGGAVVCSVRCLCTYTRAATHLSTSLHCARMYGRVAWPGGGDGVCVCVCVCVCVGVGVGVQMATSTCWRPRSRKRSQSEEQTQRVCVGACPARPQPALATHSSVRPVWPWL